MIHRDEEPTKMGNILIKSVSCSVHIGDFV
jgi:hypothetical protein